MENNCECSTCQIARAKKAVRAKIADENSTKEPYPGDLAMEAAVQIEIMVAYGGYKTVAYGRVIQEAMDKYLAQQIS